MDDSEKRDFSLKSYDEWISFLFDRPLRKGWDERPFAGEKIAWLPERPLLLIEYLTRLCLELPGLVARYDWPQINQALWGAVTSPFSIGDDHLWDNKMPLEPRIECVCAMESIYPNVVAKIPHGIPRENIFQMWWDIVCSGYGRGEYFERERFRTDDGRVSEEALICRNGPLLQAVFEALQNILALDDDCCQGYALHGLGHCPHPGSAAVVQGFIDRHLVEINERGADCMEWLEACRDGTVM